jgi:hypothetical protein
MKEFRLLTVTSANSGGQNPRKKTFHSLGCTTFALAQQKNISLVLSFAHKSGKPCGKNRKFATNSPAFNAMTRFAPFLCNPVFPETFLRGVSE